jgi:hypothetical protein
LRTTSSPRITRQTEPNPALVGLPGGRAGGKDQRACRLAKKDRAYITPSIVDAYFYASDPDNHKPVVYVVKLEGEIEPDPDCNRPGGSFACRRAKIIAIKKVPGNVIMKNRKAMIRNMHRLEAARKLEAGQK